MKKKESAMMDVTEGFELGVLDQSLGQSSEREKKQVNIQIKAVDLKVPARPVVNASTQNKQVPFDKSSPPLRFEVPICGSSSWPATEAAKPTLILGETGSGKTVSAVKPAIGAYLDYRNEEGNFAGCVIIDPKGDLLPYVRRKLDAVGQLKRLVVLGEAGAPLNFHELAEPSATAADKVRSLADAMISCPEAGTEGNHWQAMSRAFLSDIVVAQDCFQRVVPTAKLCFSDYILLALQIRSSFRDLKELVGFVDEHLNLKVMPLFVQAAIEMQLSTGFFSAAERLIGAIVSKGGAFAQSSRYHRDSDLFLEDLRKLYDLVNKGQKVTCNNPLRFISNDSRQAGYFGQTLSPMLSLLGEPNFKELIHVDPFKVPDGAVISFKQEMERGGVIVYSPSSQESATQKMVASTLKSLLVNYLRLRSDPRLVTAYVADEFHNFMSVDGHSSEARLFSWGRSFRLLVTVATQSIAALDSVACDMQGAAGVNTVRAMLNNIPNRVFFRTSDPATQDMLERYDTGCVRAIPVNRVRVKPVFSLALGESYFYNSFGQVRSARPLPLEKVALFELRSDESPKEGDRLKLG